MDKKRVLIISQEMNPYTAISEISKIVRALPEYLHKQGMELRLLMPRFGTINERRHKLHEVVRLSGMNIIVDDDDFPLIIKVASLPGLRLQVYFLDNDEFFKRKTVFEDKDGKLHDDNADRMVFFCKGALETVKKFGWPPNIIHCHGWMTSLIPLYLKTAYKNEPLFEQSSIVYSAYESSISDSFPENFSDKASINNLSADDLKSYHDEDGVHLHRGAFANADAAIQGSEEISEKLAAELDNAPCPVLKSTGLEGNELLQSYVDFYESLLEEPQEA